MSRLARLGRANARGLAESGAATSDEASPPDQAGAAGRPARRPAITIPRIAGIGPLTIRAWRPPPVLQGLAALAIYLAIWILNWTYGLVAHPGLPQLDQASADPNFYVWSLRWWPYAVSHGLNPLRTTMIGAPAGYGLAWTTTVPPVALLAAPLTWAFGPLVAFNLLTATAPALSAWAAFVLCRRLTGRFLPALVGGSVYGFSAYEINHTAAGQLNLTVSLLLPLLAYLVVLWWEGKLPRAAFVALMSLTLLVQLFLFLETFAGLTLVLVLALPLGYLLADRSARRRVARLSRQTALAYLIAAAIASPYLAYAIAHVPAGFNRSPELGALNLASLVVPRPRQTFGLTWLHHLSADIPAASYACYAGIPVLIIAVLLAIIKWRSKTTWFLACLLVLVILAAVGPDLGVGTAQAGSVPWAWLWHLPLARSAQPGRIMVFGFLILAVMLAGWLAIPPRKTPGPWPRMLLRGAPGLLRWTLGLLAATAVLADIGPFGSQVSTPVATIPAFITTGQYRHYLTRGEIVVVVSRRGNASLLWQAETNFYLRIAGGYINEAITPRTDLPAPVMLMAHSSPAVDRKLLQYLQGNGIGAILVESATSPWWADHLRYALPRSQAVGGVVIYPVSQLGQGQGRASSARDSRLAAGRTVPHHRA